MYFKQLFDFNNGSQFNFQLTPIGNFQFEIKLYGKMGYFLYNLNIFHISECTVIREMNVPFSDEHISHKFLTRSD